MAKIVTKTLLGMVYQPNDVVVVAAEIWNSPGLCAIETAKGIYEFSNDGFWIAARVFVSSDDLNRCLNRLIYVAAPLLTEEITKVAKEVWSAIDQCEVIDFGDNVFYGHNEGYWVKARVFVSIDDLNNWDSTKRQVVTKQVNPNTEQVKSELFF